MHGHLDVKFVSWSTKITFRPQGFFPRGELTPCSTVYPEKLTVAQLVKKFPAFYGTRSFITAFTSSRLLPYPEPA